MEKRTGVMFQPASYKNSGDFSRENEFDKKYERHLYSKFSFRLKSLEASEVDEKYLKSAISEYKKGYLNGEYSSKGMARIIKNNSKVVKIIIVKNGKEIKSINELKFSDRLINIFEKKSKLEAYNKLLHMETANLIRKNDIEGVKVSKLLEQISRNAINSIVENGELKSPKKVLDFLDKNIGIREQIFSDFGIEDRVEILARNIPVFNKFEISHLKRINSNMTSSLEKSF